MSKIEELVGRLREFSKDAMLPADDRDTVEQAADALEAAARVMGPLAKYVEAREAHPLSGIGDSVHATHMGTEAEAEITFSHLRAARNWLQKGE